MKKKDVYFDDPECGLAVGLWHRIGEYENFAAAPANACRDSE